MKLRVTEERDATGIARVHVDTWRKCYKDIVPEHHLEKLNHKEKTTIWAERLAARPELGHVIELNGEIVGWTAFGKNRDKRPADVAEIYGMYVLPQHWGTQVGQTLFSAAIETLQKQNPSKITLWVLQKNVRARAFL